MDEKNKLYFGDNLKTLREYVPDASVDLVYLDPPFNSSPSAFARGGERKSNRATYNVLFKEKSDEESAVRPCSPPRAFRGAAQIMAFEDTWQWGLESEAVYSEIDTGGPQIRRLEYLTRLSYHQKSAWQGGTKYDYQISSGQG